MKFSVLVSFNLGCSAGSACTTTACRCGVVSPKVFSSVEERQSCYETCGRICYYESDIDAAVSDGYSRYQSGDTQHGYPHTYNNYEGFDFPVSGPYQEYPVLSSFQAYTGGSPGADRVIFNTDGEFAGAVTHTGASGNNFVACD